MRIVCVGGGPAGLYLSLLLKLRDPGHDVTVFERRRSSASGWGVTFGPDLLQQFYRNDPESAREIQQAVSCWRDQVAYIRGEKVMMHSGGKGYSISRQRLLDILAARAQDLGVRLEYCPEGVSLSQLPEADLVVAADGVNSRIRQAVGNFQTEVSEGRNRYIWLGTNKVFEEFRYIVAPTNSGWIWAYAYGVNAESSTFIVECAPETWAGLGFDMMSTDDALPTLERIFNDHLAGHRLIGTLGDDNTAGWLNFRTISNHRWHSGKIVLVGDSAHTTHFTIGMGTTLAIQDAMALADNLHQRSDLELALQSYEQQRKAEMSHFVGDARNSARWFESITRYTDLKPQQFGELLYARSSQLLLQLPPRFAYILHHAVVTMPVLDRICERVIPAVKTAYGRHKITRRRDDQAPSTSQPSTVSSRN